MRPLNPNQFALPMMEHLADNPMAPYLKHVEVERGHFETASATPGSTRSGEHTLTAVHPLTREPIGEFAWADETPPRSAHRFQGEIEWVENRTGSDPSTGPRLRGLGEALYRTADVLGQRGQTSTRPIHSPVLTDSGRAFVQRVGGPTHEDVEQGVLPGGYHQFEKDAHEHERARYMKRRHIASQGKLFW